MFFWILRELALLVFVVLQFAFGKSLLPVSKIFMFSRCLRSYIIVFTLP